MEVYGGNVYTFNLNISPKEVKISSDGIGDGNFGWGTEADEEEL